MRSAVVVGPGAVGLTVAAMLEGLGVEPLLFGRRGPIGAATLLFREDGSVTRHDFRVASEGDVQRAELAFVAVKAFDLRAALTTIAAKMPSGVIVPLANGATEEIVREVARTAPHLTFRLGFCTFGVTVLGKNELSLRSKEGAVHFGPMSEGEKPTPQESRLTASPFFVWHAQIIAAHRKKWLFNTVINTLSAARGLKRNGDLLSDIPTLSALFKEAFILGEKRFGAWRESEAALYQGMLSLIEKTEDNENSMARDVRLARRTEVDFLSGKACDARAFPLLASLSSNLT